MCLSLMCQQVVIVSRFFSSQSQSQLFVIQTASLIAVFCIFVLELDNVHNTFVYFSVCVCVCDGSPARGQGRVRGGEVEQKGGVPSEVAEVYSSHQDPHEGTRTHTPAETHTHTHTCRDTHTHTHPQVKALWGSVQK